MFPQMDARAEERASRTGRGSLIYQDNTATDPVSHHPRSNKWVLTYLVRTIRVSCPPADRIRYRVSHMSTQGHYFSLLNRRHIPFRERLPRALQGKARIRQGVYMWTFRLRIIPCQSGAGRALFIPGPQLQGVLGWQAKKDSSLLCGYVKKPMTRGKLQITYRRDNWEIRSGGNCKTCVQKRNKRATLNRGSPTILPRPDSLMRAHDRIIQPCLNVNHSNRNAAQIAYTGKSWVHDTEAMRTASGEGTHDVSICSAASGFERVRRG